MSERSQIAILWWSIIFLVIFGITWLTLLGMIPPPPPRLSADEVAAFYSEHALNIKLGAVIASWTSAFMVPLTAVLAAQIARLEKGFPIWALVQFAGGILMSIFLVFPPIYWGVAAFNPERLAEATALINQMANLTLVTTDQYFIFQMIPITYISFTCKQDEFCPFPRWLGWLNLWIALIFEVGAFAFMFQSGPFAWDGLFVFWFPFVSFFIWLTAVFICLMSALHRQKSAILINN